MAVVDLFFFSSRRRHTRLQGDWSSDVCSSDLSGIIRSSDYTMEQLVEVARRLREEHDFRGYIHLKTIPDAAPELLAQAGRHADRLSINVELPTASGLALFAPEKDGQRIRQAMQGVDRHEIG